MQLDIYGQLDSEADQDIRHQWRLIKAVGQPDVGQGNKGEPTTGPDLRDIQALRQQTLLLLTVDIVHGVSSSVTRWSTGSQSSGLSGPLGSAQRSNFSAVGG